MAYFLSLKKKTIPLKLCLACFCLVPPKLEYLNKCVLYAMFLPGVTRKGNQECRWRQLAYPNYKHSSTEGKREIITWKAICALTFQENVVRGKHGWISLNFNRSKTIVTVGHWNFFTFLSCSILNRFTAGRPSGTSILYNPFENAIICIRLVSSRSEKQNMVRLIF